MTISMSDMATPRVALPLWFPQVQAQARGNHRSRETNSPRGLPGCSGTVFNQEAADHLQEAEA
jgi:hypothetical protein